VLAVRAAAAVVAAGGGRSIGAEHNAARLMREATFLLVFGQTSDIRAAQMAILGASPTS
jgi:alkylation response protein AidB-like acyl-CoA dehydrogenase